MARVRHLVKLFFAEKENKNFRCEIIKLFRTVQ